MPFSDKGMRSSLFGTNSTIDIKPGRKISLRNYRTVFRRCPELVFYYLWTFLSDCQNLRTKIAKASSHNKFVSICACQRSQTFKSSKVPHFALDWYWATFRLSPVSWFFFFSVMWLFSKTGGKIFENGFLFQKVWEAFLTGNTSWMKNHKKRKHQHLRVRTASSPRLELWGGGRGTTYALRRLSSNCTVVIQLRRCVSTWKWAYVYSCTLNLQGFYAPTRNFFASFVRHYSCGVSIWTTESSTWVSGHIPDERLVANVQPLPSSHSEMPSGGFGIRSAHFPGCASAMLQISHLIRSGCVVKSDSVQTAEPEPLIWRVRWSNALLHEWHDKHPVRGKLYRVLWQLQTAINPRVQHTSLHFYRV